MTHNDKLFHHDQWILGSIISKNQCALHRALDMKQYGN